jgi:hypothetical protein
MVWDALRLDFVLADSAQSACSQCTAKFAVIAARHSRNSRPTTAIAPETADRLTWRDVALVCQGDLALLLAVDPAAPDGDRLVGYTLLPKAREVDQSMVRAFVTHLREAVLHPDEVITDDSRLYPAVLADAWPTAMHQLCLFHATRRVVRAVTDVVTQVRRSLPTPPPASKPTRLGRLRDTPPADDQHDAESERYRWRLARRSLGIAQAHALHQHISSARATAGARKAA